jgi:hypothetical protein
LLKRELRNGKGMALRGNLSVQRLLKGLPEL